MSAKKGDWGFQASLVAVVVGYVVLLLALVAANAAYLFSTPSPAGMGEAEATGWQALWQTLGDRYIRYSIQLTLVSCTITAILSLLVAVPTGYALARARFRGRSLIETIIDIPIVLPPLVVGLSLLILFQYLPESLRENVVYRVPGVILAQFVVASAFAIQAMRTTFAQIDRRHEDVARTLGCSRLQAFGWVTLPEARPGMVTAFTMAWARSLGEFGPLLVFAGATRGRTEVLSTTVFLELSIGNLRGAVAVSLLMVAVAVSVLVVARWRGAERTPL
jgi:molybdate transport system permease protein